MKIVGICCSPREGKTTSKAVGVSLAAAREVNDEIETKLIELARMDIRPCIACGECKGKLACPIEDDFGLETTRNLGRRVAEVALMLKGME